MQLGKSTQVTIQAGLAVAVEMLYVWLIHVAAARWRAYLVDTRDMRDLLLITVAMPLATAASGMVGAVRVFRRVRVDVCSILASVAWASGAALIATVPYFLIEVFAYGIVVLLAFLLWFPVVVLLAVTGGVLAPGLILLLHRRLADGIPSRLLP